MSTATTSNTTQAPAGDKPEEKKEPLPQLGALEEDDEFEEFEAQDWDDSETDLSSLKTKDAAGAPANGEAIAGDSLWEENWDDDDVEDDFSKLLRAELDKTANGASDESAMQH